MLGLSIFFCGNKIFSVTTHFSNMMQLLFVHVEMDNEDVGKPVADYFGVTEDASKVTFLNACCSFSTFPLLLEQ